MGQAARDGHHDCGAVERNTALFIFRDVIQNILQCGLFKFKLAVGCVQLLHFGKRPDTRNFNARSVIVHDKCVDEAEASIEACEFEFAVFARQSDSEVEALAVSVSADYVAQDRPEVEIRVAEWP